MPPITRPFSLLLPEKNKKYLLQESFLANTSAFKIRYFRNHRSEITEPLDAEVLFLNRIDACYELSKGSGETKLQEMKRKVWNIVTEGESSLNPLKILKFIFCCSCCDQASSDLFCEKVFPLLMTQ